MFAVIQLFSHEATVLKARIEYERRCRRHLLRSVFRMLQQPFSALQPEVTSYSERE